MSAASKALTYPQTERHFEHAHSHKGYWVSIGVHCLAMDNGHTAPPTQPGNSDNNFAAV